MIPLHLPEIHQAIWKKLENAVQSRNSAWHLVTLATLRDQQPEIRTLVLRGARENNRLLWMHTDLRSPKCKDVSNNPAGALLLYDPADRWQLRLSGRLSFDVESEQTEAVWQRTSASAKRCYQGSLPPSSLSETINPNLPAEPVSPEVGRENFTRLLFEVNQMDWLFLRAEGHVRAQWHWDSGKFHGTWVIP